IQPDLPPYHPNAHGRDSPPHRSRRQPAIAHQQVKSLHHRHAGPGYGCRPRPAIGLYDIAVDAYRALAEIEVVEHRAHTPTYEPLNLLGATPQRAPLPLG